MNSKWEPAWRLMCRRSSEIIWSAFARPSENWEWKWRGRMNLNLNGYRRLCFIPVDSLP